MPKRRSKHPRSQQGKIRRSVKERTRRALRGHSLREGDRAECGVMVEEMQSGESSEVDLKSIALYKEAISMAENRYLERCSQITDGTARADAVTWGPLCDERDPAVIPSYGGDEMRRLRDELGTIGNNLKNDPQLSALEEWCRLTRDEQGKRPEIWSTIRPVIKDYAARLREVWVSRLHVLKEAPIDVTPMRVGLLKALAEATQDLSDKDDVELLDQILNEGGVHIGIDEPLNETGKWPRNRKADLANACSDDELGLSEFALHSWKNYQSAVGLEDKVKEYLQKEVKLGNMEYIKTVPENGLIAKIAAIEKRPGDVDSPIRIIDDLRRSGTNKKVLSPETLQLPGVATGAFLYLKRRAILTREAGEEELTEEECEQFQQVVIETDCEAAFRHIPVRPSERRYCINAVPSTTSCGYPTLVQHCKLAFGLATSPLLWVRVFSLVVLMVKRLMAFENNECIQLYIDDLNYYTSRAAAFDRLVKLLLLLETLGVNISYHKVRVSSQPVILGFEWNLATGEVGIPEKRRIDLLELVNEVLTLTQRNRAVPKEILQKVVGKCSWMAQIVCILKARLRPLYGKLAILDRKNLRGIFINGDSVESLLCFRNVLGQPMDTTAEAVLGIGCNEFEWAMMGKFRVNTAVAISDASTKGIAGVVILEYMAYWFFLSSSDIEQRHAVNQLLSIGPEEKWESGHIAVLELVALLCAALMLPRGRPAIALCDNSAAVSTINTVSARSTRLNTLILKVAQRLSLGTGLYSLYVNTEENWVADNLSRQRDVTSARSFMQGSKFREVDGMYLINEILQC